MRSNVVLVALVAQYECEIVSTLHLVPVIHDISLAGPILLCSVIQYAH